MIVCLGACASKRNDFSDFRNIDDLGWQYGDTLVFMPVHQDSIVTGDLFVSLRHTNDYLFSNLWIEACYSDADGRHFVDTLEITLADVYGNWSGKGVGVSFQKRVPLHRSLHHVTGSPVCVRHIMREERLKDIELIGIDFEQTEE